MIKGKYTKELCLFTYVCLFSFFLLMNGGMFSSDCKLHAGSDK